MEANQPALQMCLNHKDFKRLLGPKTKESRLPRKVSSIMRAKVLSIMRTGDGGLTSLFKPIRKAAVARSHASTGNIIPAGR